MKPLIDWAERGVLPDRLIRLGIRLFDRQRLRQQSRGNAAAQRMRKHRFIDQMKQSPIALHTAAANEQHYEMPPAFFEKVLGTRLKYSGCYWPRDVVDLDTAETAMLDLYCRRAGIEDGMRILELGCGWGALGLYLAARYPRAQILAVSNSKLQGDFIREQCRRHHLANLTVITADMNTFAPSAIYDRIVSIEMFEHMRNWERLLRRMRAWLTAQGRVFIHAFTHKTFAYPFATNGSDNWLGHHFFTGGMIPSDDLLFYFQDDLAVEKHWQVDGTHYQRTANAWLANLDRRRQEILPIMASVYGPRHAARWLQRWRIFFMACSELWGFNQGTEWLVSHYRLAPQPQRINALHQEFLARQRPYRQSDTVS